MFFREDISSLTDIPTFARQAEDFSSSSPEVLGNIINPRCNRAAWQFEPAAGLQTYFYSVEMNEACEEA